MAEIVENIEVVEVSVTETDIYLASVRDELRHWFLAYGTLAWINHVIGIWMWWALLRGRRPLWPTRQLKYPRLAMYVGWASIIAYGGFVGRQAAQLSILELRCIAIGFALLVGPTQGYVLGLMSSMVAFKKAREQKAKENQAKNDEHSKETQEGEKEIEAEEENKIQTDEEKGIQTDEELGVGRKSTDSSSMPGTTVPVEDATEKTGFLEDFANETPGAQRAETTSDENNNKEDPAEKSGQNTKKNARKNDGSWWGRNKHGLFAVVMMLGPMLMFAGCVVLAQNVLRKDGEEDMREKREVRDVVVGVAVFMGIIWLVTAVSLLNLELNGKKHEKQERGKPKTKRGRLSLVRVFVTKYPMGFQWLTSGFVVLWGQYFLLAAVASDAHGTAGLGQFDNLRLVYLVLSKVLLFAF